MRTIILATWCLAVGILGRPAWGQPEDQTGQEKQPAAAKTSNAEPQQKGTKDAPIYVYIEQTTKNASDPSPAKQSNSQGGSFDGLSAWSAFATAILTGVLVLVGAGGVCAALKTLKAIERQGNLMEIAQSASVGITHMSLIDRKPELNSSDLQAAFERSRFEITLTNTGPSKALKVRFTVNAMIGGIPGLITHTEDIKTTESSDLHPSVPMTRSTDVLSKLLPNSKGVDWQYAVAGHLIVDGTLAYEDIFGNDYETEYRSRAIGATSDMPFSVLFELISNEKKIKAQRQQSKGR